MKRTIWCAALLVGCASSKTPSPQQQAHRPLPKGIESADLDRSLKPCEDFYQFANGTWRAANPIPPSMQRWSRRWQAGEQNKEKLRDILEELSKGYWPQGSIEQVVADHYATCMDERSIDAAGVAPLQPLFAEIDRLQDAHGVQRVIRRLHELEVPAPFAFGAWVDQHQPARVIASVQAAGLGLPDRDYYLKTEPRFVDAREKYRAHLERMLTLAGRPKPKASAEAIFSFETRLAKASLDNVALRDPRNTDHLMTFKEVQKLAPSLDWVAYFDEAQLPRSDFNVTEPAFVREVERELKTAPISLWRAYLGWQLLRSAAPWLSTPIVDEWFAFNLKYLSGVAEMKPRATRCAESTDQLLGEALGRKYVERYFPPAAKARMQEMVKNLLSAMQDTIEGLTWMGPETKKKALEKLATFNPKIGYPDKWKDYSGVRISRDSFWRNLVAGRRFNVDDDRSQVGKPTDRGRWGMTPPTSDAYYNPVLNEIVFPAGILQPPAFDLHAADAVNYGAIGVVIGHEISHGFDDQGAQFDAQGRLQNWWTETDLKEFQKRGQCVVDQFEAYFIEPGIHHNGKLVLGESIGDLAGARIAYRAFQKTRPTEAIDGFTPAQQFFLAWGQFRGDATRPETQRLMVQGDPHPIAKYRVIGPLANLLEFQQVFSCGGNAPMVRQNRCEVW
jgi:endothelin-converting enzyme/putative endopeptidase